MPPLFLGDKWTWVHPLGTDQLGRDMLMRCLIGLRYSLLIGIITVVLIFIIGCGLGLFAGFKGKWWDTDHHAHHRRAVVRPDDHSGHHHPRRVATERGDRSSSCSRCRAGRSMRASRAAPP